VQGAGVVYWGLGAAGDVLGIHNKQRQLICGACVSVVQSFTDVIIYGRAGVLHSIEAAGQWPSGFPVTVSCVAWPVVHTHTCTISHFQGTWACAGGAFLP
jgi:hypothetical protein